MRKWALLAAMSVAATSNASFDMMYIPDTSGTSVHRYDPVNRVYLGAINSSGRLASGTSSTSRLALSEAGGSPYFVNGSTGEFQTSTTNAGALGMLFRASGTELLTTSGTSLRRYDATSGAVINSQSVVGTMSFAQAFAEIGSGRIAVLGYTASGLAVQTYSGTLGYLSETVVVSATNVAASSAVSSMAYVTLGGVNHLVFTYRNSSNQVTLARVSMSGGITPGSVSSDTLTGYSTTTANTITSVMAGHGGSFFVVGLGTTTTTSRIKQFYIAGGGLNTIQDYTTTAFVAPSGNYWMGSNIVAPEPGTMLALGAGLAAIMRKRRKKS